MTVPSPSERLILALDVPTVAQARDLVAELGATVSVFKIGMWLFFQPGTDQLIDDLVAAGKRVFLDYKMYDIGETVKRGVAAAAARGISFVTVHGDRAIMEAAVAGRGQSPLKILAVTVLTSLDDAALVEMGYRFTAAELVAHRVRAALECGCDGVITSAHDNPNRLRAATGHPDAGRLLFVTPGVRMADGRTHDHKRSADPATAIANGADYLVVGRPILEAADQVEAAESVIAEIARGASL